VSRSLTSKLAAAAIAGLILAGAAEPAAADSVKGTWSGTFRLAGSNADLPVTMKITKLRKGRRAGEVRYGHGCTNPLRYVKKTGRSHVFDAKAPKTAPDSCTDDRITVRQEGSKLHWRAQSGGIVGAGVLHRRGG